MMASKNIFANLIKGEKLDGNNYDMWQRKVRYILNEQEVLETLTTIMIQPEAGTSAQHRRDKEAYDNWVKKDRCARLTILSTMHNDLIGEFEKYPTAMEMWNKLKVTFDQTSVTKLRALNLKFQQYTKDPRHTMAEHLRAMSSMIRDLKEAGVDLSDEQQVVAVIRSLPDPEWSQTKLLMTYSENIKTFVDISRHLELEAERQEATKAITHVTHVEKQVASSSTSKHMRHGKSVVINKSPEEETAKRKRVTHAKKPNKLMCYNCREKGHFAKECLQPKKV